MSLPIEEKYRLCIVCEVELPESCFEVRKDGYRRRQCIDCRPGLKRKWSPLTTYQPARGHRFQGDDLSCWNKGCDQTWFGQQESPTDCGGQRRKTWGLRPGGVPREEQASL